MRKGEDPPWIVADSLWERIEPLLPKVERRSRYPGVGSWMTGRCCAKGVKHHIGRGGVEHGPGLGEHRYVVERPIALLHRCRRLRIRWEIRDDIHETLLSLATALICWRRLPR